MYQALYRKYRPKDFETLLGQEHITTTLKNQISNNNIGHAYLFSGTRGTGKTSAAKIFARAVNCLDSTDGNPCNQCANCLEILDESTMDVIEMDAASNNSVDDIRALREKVVYPPASIKYKVYIIDEVHMLSKGAFNALLKTLEEPPSHLIFILATTEPERLPQTILSRCQRFDFRRIRNSDIISNMKSIVDDLGVEIDREVLKLIARNSDGAMRDALSLLDQCISYDQDKISYEDAIDILGVTNIDLIFDLVDDIKEKRVEKVLTTIDGIIQDGKDINQFMKDLIVHFRNLMIVKSAKGPNEILELDNLDRYLSQVEDLRLDYIMAILEVLTEADSKMKWSSQGRIIMEMAVIELVQKRDNLSLEERIARLESGYVPRGKEEVTRPAAKAQAQASSQAKKPAAKKAASPERASQTKEPVAKSKPKPKTAVDGNQEIDLKLIKSQWNKVLDRIRKDKISIYALIMEGSLVSFINKTLTIGYDEGFGFHKEAISSQENNSYVNQVLVDYFGQDMRVDFIMNRNQVIPEAEVAAANSKNKAEADQAIDEVLGIFGEDMVEIK